MRWKKALLGMLGMSKVLQEVWAFGGFGNFLKCLKLELELALKPPVLEWALSAEDRQAVHDEVMYSVPLEWLAGNWNKDLPPCTRPALNLQPSNLGINNLDAISASYKSRDPHLKYTKGLSYTKNQSGFFQTFTFPAPEQIFIHDALYGGHLITEPILVELLQSPSLLRLHGVSQHGVTGLFGLTPRVSRLEHSVGAFLLVRKVGASVEEQVSALLHDVSHTALSHVVDWAFSTPGQESFHEVHKKRYIKTTELPEILTNMIRQLEAVGRGTVPAGEKAHTAFMR
ncbi:HD domain-containing protein [Coccidioides immitis H538.4]|uniref:HD domain-containing protein n=1 Tax=Coccidioides immitis H538.4 TaxID=396776 RepID=A0A0J8S458_COCIT|nr:HD domain-containing protein [Coccidioides immitis H538.4]